MTERVETLALSPDRRLARINRAASSIVGVLPPSIPLLEQVVTHTPRLSLLQREELGASEEEDPKPIERLCSLSLPRRLVGRLVPLAGGDKLAFSSAADPVLATGVLLAKPVLASPAERASGLVIARRRRKEREEHTGRSAGR